MPTTPAVLTQQRKRELRAIGHSLKPVIMIGNHGVTPSVVQEAQRALTDHELIKVRVPAGEKKIKQALLDELCQQTQAILVNAIGNTALILRENPQRNAKLSNLVRHLP